jgi:uncharacterized membrane protein/predicted flap endonuclease-1-like 5' DNA nuclease
MEKRMANKNRNLIVAYFPDADAADAAARQLKHWDKGTKEVKLGGVGIITQKKGKLKTHYVGARAGGTGAKLGTILGATGGLATGVMVLTGVLTGGIGLIPGAIAGLAVGTVGGSLFHKRIGMTDEDRARLEAFLKNGGAALAVMADDAEVAPTKAEIASLGGQVEQYTLPEEVMEEVEETQEAVEEAEEATAESFAELPLEEQEQVAVMMAAAPGLDAAAVASLLAAGVGDAETFLERAATPQGRADLAAATGYEASTILTWANELDLARVRGIGPKYAALLKQAGVDTVPELAQRNPENLAAKLAEVNAAAGIVKAAPFQGQVESWVGQAKELPRLLTY